MNDAKIIPLEQLYLSLIVQVAAADKLDAVQQDFGPGLGRLWFVSSGSTKPQASVSYRFDKDSVAFAVEHRDGGRKLEREVAYAGGLDDFAQELQKFLRANLLAQPKGQKSRPLAVVQP